jgi:hypothetical protein
MKRINKIINNFVEIDDDIKVSVDIGTNDGKVASGHKWNTKNVKKYAIDKHINQNSVLDNTWIVADSIDDVEDNIDIVSLTDVIEHIEKEDGFKFLDKLESVSRIVVISTPNGFLRQDETTHPELIKENPYMKHLSGWSQEDFIERGYHVKVIDNFHTPEGINEKFGVIVAYKRTR